MTSISLRHLLTRYLCVVILAFAVISVSTSPVSAAKIKCVGTNGQTVEVETTRPQGETCADHNLDEYSPAQGAPQTDASSGGNDNNKSCGVNTVILGCSGAGSEPITRVFMEIFNFFAVGIGILVVAGIIMGGIRYATANGNTGQAEQGITIIVNAIIGLLLFIFMFALVNWLVPGGLFS